MAKFYLARYNRTFSRNFQEISPAALEVMVSYDWPGNIRELKNVIERICIMHGGPVLMPDYLPREMNVGRQRDDATQAVTVKEMELGLELATERYEKALIEAALAGTGGNVLQAAQILKVPRGTLRYKMAKYGL